jgi:hypothetical protein
MRWVDWFAALTGRTFRRNHRPEIASRHCQRWDRLRSGLELPLDERGADMADVPGGASGLLVRDCKGKEADRLVISTRNARVTALQNAGTDCAPAST